MKGNDAGRSEAAAWSSWLLAGAVAGTAAGGADGIILTRIVSSITLPSYVVLLSALQFGALGILAAALLRLLLAAPPLHARAVAHPQAFLFPLALCVLLLPLGNRFFLPGEIDRVSLLFDGALVAASAGLGLLIAFAGRRVPGPGAGTGRAVKAGTTALLLVFFWFLSRPAAPGATLSGGGEELRQGGPNVLILLLDTLRNDHVSWNGYGRETTPNLERIARRGAIFTQLVSQAPHTKSSCASLLTSLYPTSHTAVGRSGLPRSATTLAEVFRGAGYHTFGASANTFISSVFGFDQGFEILVTLPPAATYRNEIGYAMLRLQRRFGRNAVIEETLDLLVRFEKTFFWKVRPDASQLSAPEVIDPFLDWLGGGEKRAPFFAYLHFLEPHTLYDPPAPFDTLFAGTYRGEPVLDHPPTAGLFSPEAAAPPLAPEKRANMIDRYDGEIAYLDGEIARLFQALRARGVDEHTLVVIVADHGEGFYEHRMWGHGHSLFDEELRVPLAMIWPGRIGAGFHCDRAVRMIDLMPTLLDLAGVAPPSTMQGRSFADLFDGGGEDEPPCYSEIEWSGKKYDALRHGRYKLIRAENGEGWLYDLEADPGETNDLSAARADLADSLTTEIEEVRRRAAEERLARHAGEETDMDATTRDRLRALGYIE